jgi:hypothetical protein
LPRDEGGGIRDEVRKPHLCFYSSLIPHPSSLFCEPAVSIQQLDADALLAICLIRPDAINFSFNGSTIRRREAYSGSELDHFVCD